MAKNDVFADIAAGYKVDNNRGLVSIVPKSLPDISVKLEKGSNEGFQTFKKMDTKEELMAELSEIRNYYKPFLENHAPKINEHIKRQQLTDFMFSLNGDEERKLKIPYYNGPVGKHTSVYKTEFDVEFSQNNVVMICFKGVDYIAEVFVNDVFVGRHEGFFAPFEFDITNAVKNGKNELKVIVKNDFNMMKNTNVNGDSVCGDKIYAATGIGWDDPLVGWHHCPAGFGIFNDVFVEVREKYYITDIFPRVNSDASEVWIECHGAECKEDDVKFYVSIYGQNFNKTVCENVEFIPTTYIEAGVGDTLTEAKLIAEGKLGAGERLKIGYGYNKFVIPVSIDDRKIWSPETPYLYQVQIALEVNGKIMCVKSRQFGIRDFKQDLNSTPKGKFYLNGKEIRLRGANTMGYEQQDVLRGDYDQLIDDMLLAKLCNMNFLRLTQRPVQEQIYDYCDRLGVMIQTDMPLFGTIRINQYCETLRQAEEMEKLVRSHPCCIIDSYINEPFPNSSNMPHRMITRKEMMKLFDAADDIVKMQNPDRVTKHVDGDYDPPSKLMPDNHCYTMWYNGHGLDMGKLHKGFWLDVFPGWHCGCGEFGAEGLDFEDVMKSDYPKSWTAEPFNPNNIIRAQTGPFHYFFYETPSSMKEWVSESHRHQKFATKLMTSSLRRNPLINTFAIHLFIDAWPSGWMKTIMDCKRNPKPAFFTYRDCLSPVFCDIRSDRFTFFEKEKIRLETYLVCDNERPESISYMVEYKGEIIFSKEITPKSEYFQGYIEFETPCVEEREEFTVYMGALKDGKTMDFTKETYTVYPYEELKPFNQISYNEYDKNREVYDNKVKNGEKIIISPMEAGNYKVGDCQFDVTECGMSPLYFVSRDTGHRFTKGLLKNELGYFYNSELDRMSPIIYATVEGEGITPAILSGNQDNSGHWHTVTAVGEISFGKGCFVINQLDFDNKEKNPPIVMLMNNISE